MATLLVFIYASEDSIIVEYDVTLSNPPIALVKKEELKKYYLMWMWSCEEESSRGMMHTRIDRSAWDHQLSPDPYALTIYL